MKMVLIIAVAAALGAAAWASPLKWVYEGEWGSLGSGPGQFTRLYGVDVAPDGRVYTSDGYPNYRIQYFTATGSYLGEWGLDGNTADVAVAPDHRLYTAGAKDWPPNSHYVYFTEQGSFLGSWRPTIDWCSGHFDIAPNGNVYGPEFAGNDVDAYCWCAYYTPTGSLLGSWFVENAGGNGVGVSPRSSRVYVGAAPGRVLVFDPSGAFMGGFGNGQFGGPPDVDVSPVGSGYDDVVFTADTKNHRVQYFTSVGSFLGKWGTFGTGPGEFHNPVAIAVSPDGKRVYVADRDNHRVQYFTENVGITPASLGKVKALFK